MMIDALSEFIAGLTPADVERERFGPIIDVRRDSFGHKNHRAMLAVHELNRNKFLIESHAPLPEAHHRKRKTYKFTPTQFEIALAALDARGKAS